MTAENKNPIGPRGQEAGAGEPSRNEKTRRPPKSNPLEQQKQKPLEENRKLGKRHD